MLFCKQTKLKYGKLTKKERQWLTRITKKPELAKSYVPKAVNERNGKIRYKRRAP